MCLSVIVDSGRELAYEENVDMKLRAPKTCVGKMILSMERVISFSDSQAGHPNLSLITMDLAKLFSELSIELLESENARERGTRSECNGNVWRCLLTLPRQIRAKCSSGSVLFT
jgi:hypothetical protein